MKCLIVDDEEMAIKVIESHLTHLEGLEVVATCQHAMEAFSILQKEPIDLIFLDIQMPKISGITFIRTLPNRPQVILTTAHREFAIDGYELDVVDYLLKPISLDRILRAVGKVFRLQPKTLPTPSHSLPESLAHEAAFFYIKSDRQYIKILQEEVLYLESLRNHVKIVTTQGTHITLQGISQMEAKLPPQHFLRVHRSYIVSLSKITQFSPTELIVGEKSLPIGQLYRKCVLDRLGQDMI